MNKNPLDFDPLFPSDLVSLPALDGEEDIFDFFLNDLKPPDLSQEVTGPVKVETTPSTGSFELPDHFDNVSFFSAIFNDIEEPPIRPPSSDVFPKIETAYLSRANSASKNSDNVSREEEVREKNRQAVRDCRKRKREQALLLNAKINTLKLQNSKLRRKIDLGTLSSPLEDSSPIFASLPKEISLLNQRIKQFFDSEAEVLSEAEESLFYLFSRLYQLTLPSNVTKFYLWQSAQTDDFFSSSGNSLWSEISSVIDLSQEQAEKLKARRHKTRKVVQDINNTVKKISSVSVLLRKAGSLQQMSDLAQKFLRRNLSSEQIANFIANAKQDTSPSSQLFSALLLQEKKNLTNTTLSFPSTETKSPKKETKDADLETQRKQSALGLKEIFEGNQKCVTNSHQTYQSVLDLVTKYFTQDASLFDPNFRHPVSGLSDLCLFFIKFKRAFSNLAALLQSFSFNGQHSAKSTWLMTAVYGTKSVRFDLVIQYKFEQQGSKINQLVFSWAALQLITKLGLLGTESLRPLLGLSKSLKEMDRHGHKEDASPKHRVQELQDKCVEFMRLFEISKKEERKKFIVDRETELFHEGVSCMDNNIGGCFTGVDGVLAYVNKLTRAFSDIKVSNWNFLPMKDLGQSKKDKVVKVQAGCVVSGTYHGRLDPEQQDCAFRFPTEAFFVFDNLGRIVEIVLNMDATSLMTALGVIDA